MKALTLAVALFFSLPVSHVSPPTPRPSDHYSRAARKGGRWYFSASGHAVYCIFAGAQNEPAPVYVGETSPLSAPRGLALGRAVADP